jgi:GNAT superfamily N-acetyltransferase
MGFAVQYLAVRPSDSDTLVVSSSSRLLDATRERLGRSEVANEEEVNAMLLEVAALAGADDHYLCDVLSGNATDLILDDVADGVIEFPAGSTDAKDWTGMVISSDVDGPIFATVDQAGLTAWAGIKRVSPWAQDIQIATRPDMRRKGLARKVSSTAIRRLLDDGVTPYYAHLSDNVASATLGRSLGFHPYGKAVFAESRIELIPNGSEPIGAMNEQ